jgi:hypothetical protein
MDVNRRLEGGRWTVNVGLTHSDVPEADGRQHSSLGAGRWTLDLGFWTLDFGLFHHRAGAAPAGVGEEIE